MTCGFFISHIILTNPIKTEFFSSIIYPTLLRVLLKMARITKPLTSTEVKQAKPREKVFTLSDGSGLQLRVKPNDPKMMS